MSQWILIALFLLAHPLMMLFMHKGMHGGSGSRGDEVHEHLYENGQRRVGHRILKKNTVTNK